MISVIFPTRNRASLLATALNSMTQQTLDPSEFEVLVVDNGSTDNTEQVIREYQKTLSNLQGIYAPEPGLHTGRHSGMKAAQGDLLVFADDDIVAFPTWLTAIREAFFNPEVAMVGGNNLPNFSNPPPPWLQKMWIQSETRGVRSIPALSIIEFPCESTKISPFQVWGCNLSIRKDVLLAAGGFHPDGMPRERICFRGDGETHVSRFVMESGMNCLFHSGASVYHTVTLERMTYGYFRQRGFSQGVSDSYTVLRNKNRSGVSERRSHVRRAASWGLRKFKNIISDRDVKQALDQMKLGHSEGYACHQKAYRDDVEVRDWVHLEQYY